MLNLKIIINLKILTKIMSNKVVLTILLKLLTIQQFKVLIILTTRHKVLTNFLKVLIIHLKLILIHNKVLTIKVFKTVFKIQIKESKLHLKVPTTIQIKMLIINLKMLLILKI